MRQRIPHDFDVVFAGAADQDFMFIEHDFDFAQRVRRIFFKHLFRVDLDLLAFLPFQAAVVQRTRFGFHLFDRGPQHRRNDFPLNRPVMEFQHAVDHGIRRRDVGFQCGDAAGESGRAERSFGPRILRAVRPRFFDPRFDFAAGPVMQNFAHGERGGASFKFFHVFGSSRFVLLFSRLSTQWISEKAGVQAAGRNVLNKLIKAIFKRIKRMHMVPAFGFICSPVVAAVAGSCRMQPGKFLLLVLPVRVSAPSSAGSAVAARRDPVRCQAGT